VASTNPSGRISQHTRKEKIMHTKTIVTALLATFLGMGAPMAHADDTAAKPKAARTPAPAATTSTSAAPVALSQQDRMRLCSKEATGKKGAERKDFMKTCLSKKAKA